MFYFWKQNQVKDVIFDLRYNAEEKGNITLVDMPRFIENLFDLAINDLKAKLEQQS